MDFPAAEQPTGLSAVGASDVGGRGWEKTWSRYTTARLLATVARS